jgi:cell fate (sporulation/competence/biofilm development) regulator YlbF (YheA/YmcA/DUF963 family)
MTTCSLPKNDNHATQAGRQSEIAADRLGSLLFDLPEFQTYTRLERAANLDSEVQYLRCQIRDLQFSAYSWIEPDQPGLDELNARLEALPKIRALHQADQALRQLFMQVDGLISAAAQAPFALYARAGCG